MKLLDKYISWVVVIAIGFMGTFDLLQGVIRIMLGEKDFLFNIIRFSLIFLLLLYQKRHFGYRIMYKPLYVFYILYTIIIFLDLTVLKAISIKEFQEQYPLLTFLIKSLQIIALMYCAETIFSKFSCIKFIILSFLFAVLPAIIYIQFVGIESFQINRMRSDDPDNIGVLALGYECAKVFVLCFITLFKSFRFHLLIEIIIIFIGMSAFYVIIVSGERGPIIWGMFALLICAAIKSKNFSSMIALAFVLGLIVYVNIDYIIECLYEFAPKTAERIYLTIYEGYTANRFEAGQSSGSLYTDAFNQFMSSPLFGSYFRLLPTYSKFIGAWPHNIFLEFMITMGLMGLIPFCIFLIKIYFGIKKIFAKKHEISIMACFALFLSSFLELMTSGSVLLNIEFWLFLYIMLVLSSNPSNCYNYLKFDNR